ncbi:porin [Massilia sp. LXY-6]|uniref:porin n=1 Tax=Massilia sp. LXY-6 TaxID=3379823 RepID=UPI003EDFAFAD
MKVPLPSLLIAAAAAAATILPGTSHAQSSQMQEMLSVVSTGLGPQVFSVAPRTSFTRLYGTLDLGLNYVNAGGKSSVREQSGNAWTSKFGIYGQEYLGADTTVFFRLESGITADNGAQQDSRTLFNRASYVGMSNPAFGKVTVGRHYGALGLGSLLLDPFLANAHESTFTYLYSPAADLGYANTEGLQRTNSTVTYNTPMIGGHFSGAATYALNSNQSIGSRTHSRSVSLAYVDPGNNAIASYAQGWCDPGVAGSCKNATVAPTVRTDIYLANWIHDFGPFLGSAGFIHTASQYQGDPVARVAVLALQKKFGANMVRFAAVYRRVGKPGDHAWGPTLGIEHFLSPRTALYGRVAALMNGSGSALAYNVEATSGFPTGVAGASIRSATLGLEHHF